MKYIVEKYVLAYLLENLLQNEISKLFNYVISHIRSLSSHNY
jgi:hypothetical protein